jgi:formate dehydrogenase major subunit
MERSMLGEAGFLTKWPKKALDKMIDLIKDIEPEMGYGAILQVSETEAAMRLADRIEKTKTVCTYCGVGCSFEIWTKDRHILKVEPTHGPANGISTCVKGKFGWDYVNHPDRLQKPLIREGNDFREASWEEAMSLVARRLTEIKEEHGPDSIGVIASSKCTNEDGFLMQKFARAVIGTNNTDNCSRYCQSPATQGLFRTVGYGGDSGSIADIEKADLVIIIGSNTSEAHPVLATRVKRAHKLRGQRLIVSDLREHEMARRADIFLRPEPSTDLIWLSAISRYLLDNGLAQTEFLNTWVNDLDKYRASLEPFTMEFAEERCKVSKETLIEIAHEIARSKATCILWAMGITQHCAGSDNSTAISNLLLISGNYMRPGTGAYPLRGHNNVQGASDMGAMPTYLVGYDKVSDDEARARYEKTWGVKMPTARGLDNHEMIDAVYDGKLKAVYLAGEDMVSADSDANRVAGGFERLEFFVVQDIFFTETCRYADVVFPAAPALEKDGTFTSTERRIQRLNKVFDPVGESKADWEITTELANRMGAGWTYKHPADIMAEIASLSSLFAGVTYDRLAGFQSLQWPVAVDGTDQPLLYTKHFHFPDGKARLYPLEWNEPCEQQDEQYDIHLNNGRLMEHFHEGNMTYRVKGIKEETPDRFLEVSPELAKERGILNGTWVDVISRTGKIRVQALVTDRVEGKQVYLPLTSSEGPVNVLTGSKVDKDVHTPAYKETAVKIEVLPFHGDNPLKPLNFRYSGKPTPQAGVEVERKWKRSDYRIPGQPPSLVQIHTSNGHGRNGHAR